MKISKLNCPNGTRFIYRVYNKTALPHETINEFLWHQEKRDMAPNTVKANAFDLINLDWSDITSGTNVE